MIGQIRAAFPDLTFTTEVGPLRDGEFLIGRRRADGHYAGGFPGATAAVGNTLDLLRQLGARRLTGKTRSFPA